MAEDSAISRRYLSAASRQYLGGISAISRLCEPVAQVGRIRKLDREIVELGQRRLELLRRLRLPRFTKQSAEINKQFAEMNKQFAEMH